MHMPQRGCQHCPIPLVRLWQESERRLRDLLAGKKPQGGGGGAGGDAAAVAPSVGNKKSVAARGSQMQLFQARSHADAPLHWSPHAWRIAYLLQALARQQSRLGMEGGPIVLTFR